MKCRVCGCTDDNCDGCVERTGAPCSWVEEGLCSACVNEMVGIIERQIADLLYDELSRKWDPNQGATTITVDEATRKRVHELEERRERLMNAASPWSGT